MLSRSLFVIVLIMAIAKDASVVSKPCFSSLSSMIDSIFGGDDSSEETTKKPKTTAKPSLPSITVLLTPSGDLTNLTALLQNTPGGNIFLLPGLFPPQPAAPTAAPAPTEAPTAAPTPAPTAAPVAAPAAAPAAAPVAAPAAAPAAAGAVTPAPAG